MNWLVFFQKIESVEKRVLWDLVLLLRSSLENEKKFLNAQKGSWAVQNGHAETASVLLAAGAAVNRARSDGATPLYIACQNGHAETASMLLAGRCGEPGHE